MAARSSWLLLMGSLVGRTWAQSGGGNSGGGGTNPLSLCSNQNTASDPDQSQFSIYNSYGSCTQHCAGYAYAIMQGKYCWCSNETPGSTDSVSSCSETCPGYDTDHCGNTNEGLYGYAQIGQPSGTAGASSSSSQATSTSSTSSSASSSSASSSPVSTSSSSSASTTSTSSSETSASSSTTSSSTVASSSSSSSTQSSTSSTSASTSASTSSSSSPSTSSSASSSATSSSSSSASSTSSSTSATTSSSTSSSSSTPTSTSSDSSSSSATSSTAQSRTTSPSASAATSASRTTAGSSTASPASNTQLSPNPSASLTNTNKSTGKGYWHDGGKVAGTFVGVGIGVLLIAALIFFLCWRRRRRARENSPQAKYSDTVGLGIRGHDSPSTPPNRSGGGHAFSPFAHSNSPTSPKHMRSSSSAFSNDMNLVPIFDQRVDPNQFYMRWEQNGSRASLQDNEDYSRKVLRVANPDNASY